MLLIVVETGTSSAGVAAKALLNLCGAVEGIVGISDPSKPGYFLKDVISSMAAGSSVSQQMVTPLTNMLNSEYGDAKSEAMLHGL